MAKNVLIIATSPRRNGNSNRLAKEFAKVQKIVEIMLKLFILMIKK